MHLDPRLAFILLKERFAVAPIQSFVCSDCTGYPISQVRVIRWRLTQVAYFSDCYSEVLNGGKIRQSER